MFSDVYIETTGGASPISCHGHRKADAVRMKELIERYQTDYYQGPSADSLKSLPIPIAPSLCGPDDQRPIMRLVAILWTI